MTFLVRSTWLEAEAKRQGVKVSDAEARRRSRRPSSRHSRRRATTRSSSRGPARPRPTSSTASRCSCSSRRSPRRSRRREEAARTPRSRRTTRRTSRSSSRSRPLVICSVVLTKNEAGRQEGQGGARRRLIVRRASCRSTRPTRPPRTPTESSRTSTQGTAIRSSSARSSTAKKDEIVGPVKTSDGYYVFQVDKATPGKVAQLKDVKASIQAIIAAAAPQAALTKFGQDYQDRWRGKTDCAKGYVSTDCSQAKPQRNSTVPPGAIPQQTARRPRRPGAGDERAAAGPAAGQTQP